MSTMNAREQLDGNDYTIHSLESLYTAHYETWDGVALRVNKDREYVLAPRQAICLGRILLTLGLIQWVRALFGLVDRSA